MFESGRFGLTSVKDFLAWLTAAVVFLLPWQTRWIFSSVSLGGQETPFGIFGIYVVEVLIVLLGVSVIRVYKNTSLFSTLQAPLLIFVIGLAVSAKTSQWFPVATFHAHAILVAVLFFFLIALQGEYQKRFVMAFVLGLMVPILFGIIQVFFGYFPGSTVLGVAERVASRPGDSVLLVQGARILRAYGSFPHPNIFGGYLSVALLFLFGLWNQWRSVGERWFFWVSFVLVAFGLALTFSKSAMLGAAVGVWIGVLVRAQPEASGWQKWGSLATVFAALLCISLFILTPRLQSNNLEAQSVAERVAQWQAYPGVLVYHQDAWVDGLNLVKGSGPGTYVFSWHASNVANHIEQSWWLYQPIHHVFALLFAELGIVGLIALVWFLIVLACRNYRALPSVPALTSLMACTSLFAIALFDHYLWTLWPGLILSAFAFGLAWGNEAQ